jgi:molybdopterin synthase sulfur carrier subunit
MTVTVQIPSSFSRHTGGAALLEAREGTVQEMLEDLELRFPRLTEQLWDGQGAVRQSIQIYVNGEDIRFLQGLQTKLGAQANVSIFRAIAGGSA